MTKAEERTAYHKAYNKAWYQANKDKKAKTSKIWYEENKEKHKAKGKEWRSANQEKFLAKCKEWQLANKPKVAKLNKEWAINNKEKRMANDAKRRLLKQNAEATMTEAEKKNYQELILIRDEATKLFGYAWSIDHIIPLSKGGTNAIDNLEVVPLSWNKSKRDRSTESYWGAA